MAITAKSVRAFPEPLRSLAFGSIGAGYTAIGTPLAHPARIVKIKNLTDADLLISWDGVHDHDVIPARSGDIVDETANKANEEGWYVAVGTQFYVKQLGVPGSGSIYVAVQYGYLGNGV